MCGSWRGELKNGLRLLMWPCDELPTCPGWNPPSSYSSLDWLQQNLPWSCSRRREQEENFNTWIKRSHPTRRQFTVNKCDNCQTICQSQNLFKCDSSFWLCFCFFFFPQCWVRVPQPRQEGVTPSTRASLSVSWLLATAWQTAHAKKRTCTRSTPSAGQWERRAWLSGIHAKLYCKFLKVPATQSCLFKQKTNAFLNPAGNDNDYSGEMVCKKKEQSSLGEAAVLGIHCALIQRA